MESAPADASDSQDDERARKRRLLALPDEQFNLICDALGVDRPLEGRHWRTKDETVDLLLVVVHWRGDRIRKEWDDCILQGYPRAIWNTSYVRRRLRFADTVVQLKELADDIGVSTSGLRKAEIEDRLLTWVERREEEWENYRAAIRRDEESARKKSAPAPSAGEKAVSKKAGSEGPPRCAITFRPTREDAVLPGCVHGLAYILQTRERIRVPREGVFSVDIGVEVRIPLSIRFGEEDRQVFGVITAGSLPAGVDVIPSIVHSGAAEDGFIPINVPLYAAHQHPDFIPAGTVIAHLTVQQVIPTDFSVVNPAPPVTARQ